MADQFSYAGVDDSPVRQAEFDMAKLAFQGAQTETQQQHARLYGSMADEHIMKVDKERRWTDLAQRVAGTAAGVGPDGKPIDVADQMDNLAREAFNRGFDDHGLKAATGAAQIRSRNARAVQQLSDAGRKQLQASLDDLRLQEGFIRSATDQASWDAGVAAYERQTGRPFPYRGTAFSPELKQTMADAVTSKHDELHNTQSHLDRWARQDYQNAILNGQKAARDILQKRLDAQKEYWERTDKNGGKGSGRIADPGSRAIEAAELLIKDEELDISDATEKKLATQAIASRAKELQGANRGLGMTAAIQQAYTELQQAGAFPQTQKELFGFKVPGTTKTKFAGKGFTAKTAAPLPTDKSKIVPARWYLKGGDPYYITADWRVLTEDEFDEED